MQKLAARLIVFLATVAGMGIGAASASQIVQTKIFDGDTCEECGFGADFKQFNPVNGVLTGMTVSISGEQLFTVTIYPVPSASCGDNCTPGAFYGFSVGFTLNGPGFPYLEPYESSSFFAVTNYTDYIPDFNEPQTSPFQGISYVTATNDLAAYIGTGTVQLDIGESEDSDYCYPNDGWVVCDMKSTVKMAISLTYIYAPEPSTIAIMGAGLAIFGMGFRRRSPSVRKRSIAC